MASIFNRFRIGFSSQLLQFSLIQSIVLLCLYFMGEHGIGFEHVSPLAHWLYIGAWAATLVLFAVLRAIGSLLTGGSLADPGGTSVSRSTAQTLREDEMRSAFFAKRAATEALFEIAMDRAVEKTAHGALDYRVATEELDGVFRRFGEALNQLLEQTDAVIRDVGGVLSEIANGGVSTGVKNTYQGEFKVLANNANEVAKRLGQFAEHLGTTVSTVNSASEAVATGSGELAHRTDTQSAALTQSTVAMEQLAEASGTNAERAQKVHDVTQRASTVAAKGATTVEQAVDAMQNIE